MVPWRTSVKTMEAYSERSYGKHRDRKSITKQRKCCWKKPNIWTCQESESTYSTFAVVCWTLCMGYLSVFVDLPLRMKFLRPVIRTRGREYAAKRRKEIRSQKQYFIVTSLVSFLEVFCMAGIVLVLSNIDNVECRSVSSQQQTAIWCINNNAIWEEPITTFQTILLMNATF